MKLLSQHQSSCPVAPDYRDEQYRKWAEEHFSGNKTPKCYWEHLESEACLKRLAFAEAHEYTAGIYINFKDFVGRPIDYFDWSALCSCCENCDIFQISVQQAAERGLCTPCLDGCNVKEKKLILKTTLVQVAVMHPCVGLSRAVESHIMSGLE